MKTNNMLIALYFAVSVVLLSFTRTMAENEEDLILGEQLNVVNSDASENSSNSKPPMKPVKEKDRPIQLTVSSIASKLSQQLNSAQDKGYAQKQH